MNQVPDPLNQIIDILKKMIMRGDTMFKKMLVALDGSDQSKHALKYAIDSASKWDAELLMISVIPFHSALLFYDDGASMIDLDEYDKTMKKIHSEILADAKAKVESTNPDLKVKIMLRTGHVPSVIIEEADKEDADLIIMGSRGLSGIRGWVLGSVSKAVAEQCRKPILLVK